MVDTTARTAAASRRPAADQPTRPGGPRRMTPVEFLGWAWRQLRSMRTALVLLFLLALAAVPGSVIPQRNADSAKVNAFAVDHPGLALWFDRLGLFSVYSSPWFAAVYLLLFTSLVGCIVPRTLAHARALRVRPTLTPRVLSRMPAYATWTTDVSPEAALAVGESVLAGRRHLRPGTRLPARRAAGDPVAVETGRLRESGNLLFHVALLVVLGGVAAGGLVGYRATTIVIEGQGFANGPLAYSDLSTGAFQSPAALPGFSVDLSRFRATFWESGPAFGTARSFEGSFAVTPATGGPARQENFGTNHPVSVDGAQISLLGNGYAPVITIRRPDGGVAYQGPTVFLPKDLGYTSEGVVKIAPTTSSDGLEVTGNFLPTAASNRAVSQFADLVNPELRLTAYHGRFGLGAGSGSVYLFDRTLAADGTLKQYRTATGQPLTFSLTPGGQFTLPDGDTVSFDGVRRWVNVLVDRDPGATVVLGGAAAAVAGLCASLFVRRRRWWVRAGPDRTGRTVVEVAGLDRSDSTELEEKLARVVARVQLKAPVSVVSDGNPSGADTDDVVDTGAGDRTATTVIRVPEETD